MEKTPAIDLNCYHCGEPCTTQPLIFQQKHFCCQGCQMVYEVLDQNNLGAYYDLEKNPGLSQKTPVSKQAFAFLEDEKVASKLIDFKDDQVTHITFQLPQIHCSSCIWLLENLNRLQENIIQSRVDFVKKEARIVFKSDSISLRQVAELLSSIGYEPAITLVDLDKKSSAKKDRSTLYKLGVAGFCFGNIMLFSFPEYFSNADFFHVEFAWFFGYLNILLALPVFFYSSMDYFRSAYLSLRQGILNMDVPISLGIFALFFYSLYEILLLKEAGYMDTLAALLFLLLIGKLFQQRTYDTLSFDRDYKSYFQVAITRLKQDQEEVVALTELKIGDRILVRNNELIPADAILYRGRAHIDYSFVTGESVPVPKTLGEIIYSGGRQMGEAIELEVVKAPSQSYLTELWNSDAFNKPKQDDLTALSTRVSKYFTITVLLIALGALVFWLWNGQTSIGIKAFTTVLIIACPCALAMSTPFTLGNTLRIFGRNKFYLKNAATIERMAQIDTLVFDKTGTLSSAHQGEVLYEGELLGIPQLRAVKSIARQSTHPLSMKLAHSMPSVDEVPISHYQERVGLGVEAIVNGDHYQVGSAAFVGWTANASSGSKVFVACNGKAMGYFKISAAYREGVDQLATQLKDQYQLHLLSGDHDHEKTIMRDLLGEKAGLHFNQSPQEKLQFLENLNQQGHRTIMIGDGLNDAGALQRSTVGISVTENVNHFSPACDAIMAAEELPKLAQFLRFSKINRTIIIASFGLSFAYNAVGLAIAVQGQLSPLFAAVFMPLSSVSVILFTTISTNWTAYKMGFASPKKQKK